MKAMLFKDTISAAKIMAATTALESKRLGYKVQNFDIKIWKKKCEVLVKPGLVAKFSQNTHCYKALEATNETILVEASQYDSLWGVGLSQKNPDLANMQLWKGDNLLGKLLIEV